MAVNFLEQLVRMVRIPGIFHSSQRGLLLSESHLTRRLFGAMLQRIWALPVPTG
jgi:hypothetical protein